MALESNTRLTAASLSNRFDRRSMIIGGLQGGVGLLLAARMGYIAVAENERYRVLAESNRVNLSLIPPRRGWILDRNGAALASNRSDFRIDIIPDRMTDKEQTLTSLSQLLNLTPIELQDLRDKIDSSGGFQPIEVASGLDLETFSAISVRLPDLPGVFPQRGFSRYYPSGPSVGHLIGYVGPASREEYEEDKVPLLLTPGFKLGKDGLERQFEKELRGEPGARRVEVTAGGDVVRELANRDDVPGAPINLTIDGPLQDYAARRLGNESGSVVVLDCETGDILCMASMPSFDPNSFSNGIGRVEYKMLSEDDRVPLRNKVLKGLYPPASTVKPMVSMALLEAGVGPEETVFCGGGLRVGDRVFRCHRRRGHGNVNMERAVAQSCDVYYYAMAQRIGMTKIANMLKRFGMGQTFDLPVVSQFFGTVPDPDWKVKKYDQPWYTADTVNATIGQGYMLANPLQLAVTAARCATGKEVVPRLLFEDTKPEFKDMGFSAEHLVAMREAMAAVVSGAGTAGRAAIPIPGIRLAGKTGTAQVVGLEKSDGRSGPRRFRDHGLFTFFAPFDNPRFAGAVVIEHGGGSSSAYPIARDVATYLFDPNKGLEQLRSLESSWGGTAKERLERRYRTYAAEAGVDLPSEAPTPDEIARQVDAEARAAAEIDPTALRTGVAPRDLPASPSEPSATPAPAATATPATDGAGT